MSAVAFEPTGPGHYRVTGPLRFDTAMEALEKSRQLFADHTDIVLDLHGVDSADSAGLALLVEWVGWAHREKRRIHFQHLPAQVLALAHISEVDKLLPGS